MFKIENNEIYCTRGDKGKIPVKIPLNKEKTEFYQFQPKDILTFGLYNKNQLNEAALILKDYEVTEVTDLVKIPLSSEETKIGELINKEKEYWYEITLNHEETILGYTIKEKGRKFWLLPEGSDKKC